MSAEAKHEWKYDGGGGGHNGEYTFTCKLCGASDWVSYASMREGDKPNAAGCRGKVTPQRPHKAAEANPEAIARLRKYVDGTATLGDSRSRVDDLRALLDAHAALETAHTEALDALQAKMDLLATTTLMSYADADTYGADVDVRVEAVLAKAGRR